MKKTLFLFLIFSPLYISAQNLDSAMFSSTSGIIAQKIRVGIIAENVANISNFKVEETGLPYQKKYAVLEAYQGGVRVKSINTSKEPFLRYNDGTVPQANDGYYSIPNVSLPEEMLNLNYTEAMYEANVTAFKVSKNLYQSTIDLLK